MVKVECDGCKAPYQIDEKRIPAAGLKMRCPKCGTNLLVTRPGSADADLPAVPVRSADADLPAIPARSVDLPSARAPQGPPGAPRPGAPRPAAPRLPPKAPDPSPVDIDGPAPPSSRRAAVSTRGRSTELYGASLRAAPDPPEPEAGFGEIELGIDLPAPVVPGGGADLPAARAPRPPAAPPPDAPVAAPFTIEVDLPVPHGGHTDLPSARAAPPRAAPPLRNPTVNFGDIDLPATPSADLPSPARGAPPRAAPPPRNPTVNFGDIDLPDAPAELPSPVAAQAPLRGRPGPPPPPRGRTVNFGDIDLPSAPDEGVGLPQAVGPRGFGEIDLPLGTDDAALPAPAYGSALPMPAQSAGLPMAAPGAGLPMPAQSAGFPMAAPGGGLPMPAQGAGFPMAVPGGGLPMPAQGGGLPMAVAGGGLPMPAQGQGYPTAMQDSGLPMAMPGGGLPMAMPGGGLPMAAHDGALPMAMPGGGLPMAAQGQGYPVAVPGGGLPAAHAGFDLGEEGAPRPRTSAFDDSDRAVPSQMDAAAAPIGAVGIDLAAPTRAAVGDEVDLAAPPPASPLDLAAQAPEPRRAREPEGPVKKGNARKIALFGAVALSITGGALALSPSVGPFGFYLISDQINAKSNAAQLDQVRKDVGEKLDLDTHAAVSAAMERCAAGRAPMPRFRPAAAYCAHVALERGLRFGRRTDDEALAKQLLAAAGDGGGDAAKLATAALDVLAGQPAKARDPVAAVAQRAPDDEDAAVLAADVEVADKAAKPALAAWKHAVDVKKSARTLFGLARAQRAAGDPAAEATGLAVLAASPLHAGARTLVASIIWTDVGREPDAQKLLKEVTDPGTEVHRAASEGEVVDALTETGNIHLARSRISAAEEAFGAALKLNPLAVQALLGDGELLYHAGRYSEALARFDAAGKADPGGTVPQVGIAKSWIALERMKEAKDLLVKLRASKPGEPLVSLWLGHAHEALGARKDAETAYREAIKLGGSAPAAVDAYVALAHLLGSVGRTEDANAALAEASKKFADLAALHRARGELALQMGRYDEARSELVTALEKEDDVGTRFRLGVALRRMRRFDEAGVVFDKVAAVDKDYPGLALERGLLFEETGQSERALELYTEARKKAANDVDLKLRVGSTQVVAGHPREALAILEEVRKERPNSAEVNHFLGRAMLLLNQNLVEAIRYLERAVSIDPNRAEYYLYVGWAANELGQSVKAGPALNRAIELDRDLGDAYWQRGVLLQKGSANVDALKDLTIALEKRPSRFEAWATIALCDQDLQKWPEAEQAWRRAIAGNDAVAEWHYRLGKLLTGHGNRAGALPELEKAVTLGDKPDLPPAQWLYDAHFLLADAYRGQPANKAKAIEHYTRFLALVAPGNAYIDEAQKALVALGVKAKE